MKKKIVLISLLSASLISVSLVSVFAGKRSGNLDTIVRAGKPSGRHYPGIEATETSAGLREYWTNCDGYTTTSEPYNIADYADMTVADSQAVLADLLANSPSDSRIINAHEHYDINFDYFCDEPGCEYEFEGIESISISCLTTYIGSGESVVLKANVEAHGDVSTEVEWSLSAKSPSMFILVDNKDGTATLTGADFSGTSSYSATITATSVFDPLVSSAGKSITVATYGDAKRSTLNGYFGEGKWQTIPYFVGATITYYDFDDSLSITKSSRTGEQMVASFNNLGNWTFEREEDSGYYVYYSLVDSGYLYTAMISGGSSKGIIDITRIAVSESWPTSEVAGLVSDKGATGTVPAFEGATYYSAQEGEYSFAPNRVLMSVADANAALSSYLKILNDEGWFVFENRSGYDYYGYEGKTLSICPFIENGNLVLELDCESYPVSKPLTEWPAAMVASALTLAEETVLAPVGTRFSVNQQSSNLVGIKVEGSDTAYIAALKSAGYTVESDDHYYHITLLSPTGTIKVVVDYDYYEEGSFVVTLTSQLPAGVTSTFPLDEVKNIIKGSEANDVVAANGSRFTLTKNADYDVSVKVEGGSKFEFQTEIAGQGFDSAFAGSYFKGNLCCDISGTESEYTINYYLAEAPAPVAASWPMEKIKSACYGKEVPAPSVYESAEVTTDTASSLVITVTGSDFVTYADELRAYGLTVPKSGTSRYVYDQSFDIAFDLIKQSTDGSSFTLEFVIY